MREQFLSASPIPHSLGTFLAEQESTAPGRENKRAGFEDLDSYDIERYPGGVTISTQTLHVLSAATRRKKSQVRRPGS